jgi:hypothetical protein
MAEYFSYKSISVYEMQKIVRYFDCPHCETTNTRFIRYADNKIQCVICNTQFQLCELIDAVYVDLMEDDEPTNYDNLYWREI